MSARHDFPVSAALRARELRSAGWQLRSICDILEREIGSRPDVSTVQRWANPDVDEKNREKSRRSYWRTRAARGGKGFGRLGHPHHTKPYQEARAVALVRNAGLRTTQAALVMAFDYPDHGWTADRVRHLVRAKEPSS